MIFDFSSADDTDNADSFFTFFTTEYTEFHRVFNFHSPLSSRAKRRISVTHSWALHFSSADNADNTDSFYYRTQRHGDTEFLLFLCGVTEAPPLF